MRIMVVNTEEDSGVFTGALGGRHWFVAAWYVDPDDSFDSTIFVSRRRGTEFDFAFFGAISAAD